MNRGDDDASHEGREFIADGDGEQLRIYTLPGDQKQAFVDAMIAKQIERGDEVGGHVWEQNADEYGPRILYAEIANINARLKQMFWDSEYVGYRQRARAQDLLVDLGNYASFLHDYIGRE